MGEGFFDNLKAALSRSKEATYNEMYIRLDKVHGGAGKGVTHEIQGFDTNSNDPQRPIGFVQGLYRNGDFQSMYGNAVVRGVGGVQRTIEAAVRSGLVSNYFSDYPDRRKPEATKMLERIRASDINHDLDVQILTDGRYRIKLA